MSRVPETLDDAALLEAFEGCSLPESEFSHRAHVRIAWLCLASGAPFEEAAARFCRGLRRYAASLGRAERYHETITWAFLAIVGERRQGDGAASFAEFAAENLDLFEPKLAPLLNYYDAETLHSEQARRAFVLPRVRGQRDQGQPLLHEPLLHASERTLK